MACPSVDRGRIIIIIQLLFVVAYHWDSLCARYIDDMNDHGPVSFVE
jgi:hypothetical protein